MIHIKRFCALLFAVAVVTATTPFLAFQQKAHLESSHFAVNLDLLNFTDDVVKNSNMDRSQIVGVEGYFQIAPSRYLGAEAGYGKTEGSITHLGSRVDTEVIFIPVVFNLKYDLPLSRNLMKGKKGHLLYYYLTLIMKCGCMIALCFWSSE